jgi:hypothetical protein
MLRRSAGDFPQHDLAENAPLIDIRPPTGNSSPKSDDPGKTAAGAWKSDYRRPSETGQYRPRAPNDAIGGIRTAVRRRGQGDCPDFRPPPGTVRSTVGTATKMGLSPSAARGQVRVFGLRFALKNSELAEKRTSPRAAYERLREICGCPLPPSPAGSGKLNPVSAAGKNLQQLKEEPDNGRQQAKGDEIKDLPPTVWPQTIVQPPQAARNQRRGLCVIEVVVDDGGRNNEKRQPP